MLEVQDLSLGIGDLLILKAISLHVEPGEIFSAIGPNGAGKTSLLNCIGGFYRATGGDICFQGQSIRRLRPDRIAALGIARTFQNIEVFPHLTVTENILLGRYLQIRCGVWADAFWTGAVRREEVAHRLRVEEIVEFLEMEAIRDEPLAGLPYGLRKKVELARALAMEPKLLLLDEPFAGMNQAEKEDMVRYLIELNRLKRLTIFLIDHDMRAVMAISQRVVVLNYGTLVAAGTPAEIWANPLVAQAYLGEESGAEEVARRG